MTHYYCVIRFSPDPIIDERFTLGVVVFGNRVIRTRFIDNYAKIAQIFPRYTELLSDVPVRFSRMTEEAIRCLASNSTLRMIQVSCVRASLLSLDELYADVVHRYLEKSLLLFLFQ